MKRYVVIGGSIAGLNCAESIRGIDPDGRITVVSAEPVSNYSRPLISYYLQGRTGIGRMSYKGADFYERNRIEVLHGTAAKKIDAARKQVELADGGVLDYDALCVCTGSSPFCPRFDGLESIRDRFFFTTLADALALEKRLKPSDRVLIIGAGFIGLKCAEGLAGRAAEITVCDLAPHVMSASLDADSAPLLERRLEQNGIRLLLGDTAERFEAGCAHMKSGRRVEFDILVIAIGVRPDTALVKDAGGKIGKGILVDEAMRTSLPGVWAAGDCVECTDITTGSSGVLAVLPNAAMQGRCAGINMAGGSAAFDRGMRMNSVGFFGLHVMSAGSCGGEVYSEISGTDCKKFFVNDGFLTGFILVGDVRRAGIYTSLIRERTPLDSIDFEAVRKEPSLLPFGRGWRRQKLGGMV